MKDFLISLYIDDELDLDEKITFVETVHDDRGFTDETVELLRQEKRLRDKLTVPGALAQVPASVLPAVSAAYKKRWSEWLFPWIRPLAGFATALALVAGIALLRPAPSSISRPEPHRFVVYLPQSHQARIIGTFTGWQPVPMERVGTSGYWTLTLPVPAGEHRYSYLVEEDKQIADPTVVAREQDDFGGENSVIEVQVAI